MTAATTIKGLLDSPHGLARVGKLGADGLRVLAVAAHTKPMSDGQPFESLTFLGLIGLEDPCAPTCRMPSGPAMSRE